MPYGISWDELKPDGYSGNTTGEWGDGNAYRWRKCATEGCSSRAEVYLQGVGESLYCQACAKAIASFVKEKK